MLGRATRTALLARTLGGAPESARPDPDLLAAFLDRRDEQALPCLLWWLWAVLGYGRRCRPAALQGDRGYGFPWSIGLVVAWGIRSLLAERGTAHGSGLGRARWVVERAISWLTGLRRLRVRYDRLGVVQDAWDTFAACAISYRLLHDRDSNQ